MTDGREWWAALRASLNRGARRSVRLLMAIVVAVLLAIAGEIVYVQPVALPTWVFAYIPVRDGLVGCTETWLKRAARESCFEWRIGSELDAHGVRALPRIDRFASRERSLGTRCHSIMHRAAPAWAQRHHIDLRDVDDVMPSTVSTNCAAGFLHGVLAEVGRTEPHASTQRMVALLGRTCSPLRPRAREINCLHGIGHFAMQRTRGSVRSALATCSHALGADAVDCAPGVFHQLVMNTKRLGSRPPNPFVTCQRYDDRFADACWVRLLQLRRLPERINGPADIESYCARLTGDQRLACITGATWSFSGIGGPVIGDCEEYDGVRESRACFRGTLIGFGDNTQLLDRCRLLHRHRWTCIEWYAYYQGLGAPDTVRRRCGRFEAPVERRICLAALDTLDRPLGVQ